MKIATLALLFLIFFGSTIKAESPASEKNIRNVYSRLISSIGDMSRTPPVLELVNSRQFVAQYIPSRNLIQLEYAAFDICRQLGEDSLDGIAFIIAHELGHYYRNHSWLSEAGSAYASLDMGEKLASAGVLLDTLKKNEAEADEFACFYSKLAGYSIHNTDNLLKKIYKEYELPDDIKRYPSLNERQAIANHVRKETSEWNDLFCIANVLLLNSEFESAVFLYKQILNKGFGSREIYNNIGVSKALKGLEYINDDFRKISYPFEIDFKSRLSDESRGMPEEDSLKAVYYFSEAADQFERAYQLDKNYLPAQLNLAICKALYGEYDEADFRIKKIIKLFKEVDKDSQIKIEYAKSVIDFLSGNKNQAVEKFHSLASHGYSLAQQTITALDGQNENPTLADKPISFDTLTRVLPAIDVLRYGKRKANFSGNDGSVTIFQNDTLNFHIYYLDFKGPGGFRRVFTLYQSDIKNDVFKDYFNFQENILNAGNGSITPTKSYTKGSDNVNFYSGNSVNVCIFNEKNIPKYFIATKH